MVTEDRNVTPTAVADEPTLAEIQEERNLAKRITVAISIDRLAIQDPDRVVKVMENRMKALESIRLGAVRNTEPHDWTLNKDKEGHVIATVRKSGCTKVRKYFGISTVNVRPQEVVVKANPEGGTTAEIWADGICALTGEMIANVRGARSSSEEFVGRNSLSDLKEAARTNLENKIARILAGMTAVSVEELKAAWAGTEKRWEACYKGHGYGKSAERTEANGNGGEATLAALEALLKAVAAATNRPEKDLLAEATIYQGKDGKKYWAKGLQDLKHDWQIARAVERLQKQYGAQLPAPTPAEVAS